MSSIAAGAAGRVQVDVQFVNAERNFTAALRQVERLGRGGRSSFGNISSDLTQFNRSLDAATARVISFGATASVLFSIERAFMSVVKSTVGVQKALADINVILGASERQLGKFGANLFDIAKDTGQTFDTITKAATELSRQGLSVAETLERTRAAMILVRLTGMDANTAITDLTATINSFSESMLTGMEVVNKFAAVDAAFAVNSKDLAEAVKRVGSTAKDAGVDLDQLVGIVTSLQQTTARGGAVIGNALKTIFTKIQDTKVLDQLALMGVRVRDMNDNVLPARQLLDNLAESFSTLGQESQNSVAKLVGNVYQINQVRAALRDLGRENSVTGRATAMSAGATNEAAERNALLNQTLAAQFNRLGANVMQVGAQFGNSALSPTLGFGTGILNTILEGAISKDADNYGQILGKGIVQGLGQFLQGPGTVLIGATLLAIMSKMAGHAMNAIKANLMFGKGEPVIFPQGLAISSGLAAGRRGVSVSPGFPAFPGIPSVSPNTFAGIPTSLGSNLTQAGNLGGINAAMQAVIMGGLMNRDPMAAFTKVFNEASLQGASSQELAAIRATMVGGNNQLNAFNTQQARIARVNELAILGSRPFAFGARRELRGLSGTPFQTEADAFARGNARMAQSNMAMFGSFLPSIVAGAATDMTDSRAGKAAISGVGETASFALMGFGISGGNPLGGVIGGTIGLLIGLNRVFKEMNTTLPELTASAQKAKDELASMDARIAKISMLAENIAGIRAGTIKPTENLTGKISQEFFDTTFGLKAGTIAEIQDALLSGNFGNLEEATAAMRKTVFDVSQLQNFKTAARSFAETGKGGGDAVSRLFGMPGVGEFLSGGVGQSLIAGISATAPGQRTLPVKGSAMFPELVGKGIKVPTPGRLDIGGLKEAMFLGGISPGFISEISDSIDDMFKKNPDRVVKFINDIKDAAAKGELRVFQFAQQLREMFPEDGKAYNPQRFMARLGEGISLAGARQGIRGAEMVGGMARNEEFLKALEESQIMAAAMSSNPAAIARLRGQAQLGDLGRTTGRLSAELGVQTLGGINSILGGVPQSIGGASETTAHFVKAFLDSMRANAAGIPGGGVGAMRTFQAGLGNFQGAIPAMERMGVGEQMRPVLNELSRVIESSISSQEEINRNNENRARIIKMLAVTEEELATSEGRARVSLQQFNDSVKDNAARLSLFGANKAMFSSDMASAMLGQRQNELLTGGLSGKAAFGAAGASFTDQFKFGAKDMFRDLMIGAAELGQTMKSSFKDAFKSFVDGTNDAKGALQSLGFAIFDKLLDRSIDTSMNLLFGGVSAGLGAAFGRRATGGRVGYAGGGMVVGGSGMRDDVPAMLDRGSFVIRKSSVNKFGPGFFGALNFQSGGSVNVLLKNRFAYDNEARPTSGSFDVSPFLSAFGQTDENNPQNAIKFGREQDLYRYISEKAAFEDAQAQAMAAFKRAKRQRVLGALISAGVGIAGAGLASAFGSGPAISRLAGPGFQNIPQTGIPTNTMPGGPMFAASGGHVDKVPAMLTGGEFVMSREAVNRLGTSTLESLNRGQLPGFQTGGAVGVAPRTGTSAGGDSVSDLLSRLVVVNEAIREAVSSKGKGSGAEETPQSQTINDIKISVSVDAGGRVSEKTSSTGSGDRRNEDREGQSRLLAEQIKAAVIKVIIEQKRPNGLLSS